MCAVVRTTEGREPLRLERCDAVLAGWWRLHAVRSVHARALEHNERPEMP